MKERDYKHFDYMSLIVKDDFFDEVKTSYASFGWEIDEEEDEKSFSGARDVVFKRKHKLAQKDELQRLQVYMESEFMSLSQAERNHYSISTVFGLSSSLLFCAILVYFIFFATRAQVFAYKLVAGIVIAVCILVEVCIVFRVRQLRKVEDESFNKKKEQAKENITKLCIQAKNILENTHDR